MKLQQKVRVKNRLGLHTRPATTIVQLLKNSQSIVLFNYQEESINAKSIFNILMLAAPKNAEILITVEGQDAEATMNNLVSAFENEFGEAL